MKQPGTGSRVLLTLACIVIVIAGLKAASAILLPALVAVFLAVVSYPPIAWLQSRGLPDWAAVLIVFVVVVAVFGGISVVVGHSIQDFTAKLDDYEQLLTNNRIWFLNRDDGSIVHEMGHMGENGGQFFGLHMIAVDSQGNIYTGEVFAGERVQRFVPTDSPRGELLQQLAALPLQ